MRLGDVAGLGEQQRDGVLGGGEDVRLRGVDHHHAAARRRLDVDVVEPDAGTAKGDQAATGLEDRGRDDRLGPDDESGRADNGFDEAVGAEPDPNIELVTRGCHLLEPARRKPLGHEDPRHC